MAVATTTSSSQCFFDFPSELLRDIFELAAADDKRTSLSLALVSSWSRHWTLHILYHTVLLESARSLKSFAAALSTSPLLAPLVQHLGIFTPGPASTIQNVISACPSVKSLACGFTPAQIAPSRSPTPPLQALPPSPHTKEQHLLGLACRSLHPSALAPGLARLRLHLPDASTQTLALLPSLPASLTHLALVLRSASSTPDLAGALHALLDARPALRVVLVQLVGRAADARPAVDDLNRTAKAPAAPAPRRRLVAEHAPLSVVAQWETAARRGGSVWDRAEQELRERRRRWSEPASGKQDSDRALFRQTYHS